MAQKENDMVLVGDVTLWHKGSRIWCWWEKWISCNISFSLYFNI